MKRYQIFALVTVVVVGTGIGAYQWRKDISPFSEISLRTGIQVPDNSKVILWENGESGSEGRFQIPLAHTAEFIEANKLVKDKIFSHEYTSNGWVCRKSGDSNVLIKLVPETGILEITTQKNPQCEKK